MRFLLTAAFAALTAVAAPAMAFFDRDPGLDYEALIAEGAGLRDDFWTLSVANADQCKDTTYRLGFEVIALAPAWKSWDRFVETADLQMGVSIVQVAKGSPAAVAGIQPGDRLLSLGGQAFKPQHKPSKLDKQLERIRKLQTKSDGASLAVTVERAGQTLSFDVVPARVCDADIVPMHARNGTKLYIESEERFTIDAYQLEAVTSERERMIVVAHEFAHYLEGHYTKGKVASGVARGLGAITGLSTPMLNTGTVAKVAVGAGDEKKADAASLALLAAQGIEPAEVLAFWERLGEMTVGTRSKIVSAHPVTESRLDARREAVSVPAVARQDR
jgi:membrane-associated protease RseP (regulator of RpoE activity)